MQYVYSFLWAGLAVIFIWLFFDSFLESECQKNETAWFLMTAWLVLGIYGCFKVEGIYGYLMYLLIAVLMLLCLFGEESVRGLCLLVFVFLISVCCDYMVPQMEEGHYYLIMTIAKLQPFGCVWILRRFGRKSRSSDTSETEELLLRQHMEMQQESMEALEQNYRMQRKNSHEFEHHLQVLQDLLDKKEIDAAGEYLGRLRRNRSIHVMAVNSRHPVIDVILNQKYQTARESGIRMQIQVNDLSEVEIPSDSLVVVLTNLLDNAIEACCRIDGYREIFCSILCGDGLYISIRNTSEPVLVVDGKIPTSKKDSLSHGFGLMSVGYVLDKLEAEYTFGYDEGWFYFAAEIGYQ